MGIIPIGRSMSLSAELPCRHPKQYAERPELSTPFRDGFSTAGAPSLRTGMHARAREGTARRGGCASRPRRANFAVTPKATETGGIVSKVNTWTVLGRKRRSGEIVQISPSGKTQNEAMGLAIKLNREVFGDTWATFFVSPDSLVARANPPREPNVTLPGDYFGSTEAVRTLLTEYGLIEKRYGGNYRLAENGWNLRGILTVLDYFGFEETSAGEWRASKFLTKRPADELSTV